MTIFFFFFFLDLSPCSTLPPFNSNPLFLSSGDLRRLASDCGIAVADRPAAEVVDELKARLFRSAVPWLLTLQR